MADIRFHPEAEAEYRNARLWYHARSPEAAVRFELEVERVLGLIASTPDLFPRYDDEHRFAVLRRYPYSIVYRIEPNLVHVIALAHSSRSAGFWRGRT